MKRTISLIALLVTLLLVSCGKLNFSNKVIVEFDTKGGSEIGSKILNKDASLNEPNPPTKEGYSFLGWYSDSDYDNEIESFPLTIERDLVLYAKWEINTYRLTFLVDE